jgi:N-acetylglucosaminyl-diphospho-decaprenol L-rhamnosyltransferase
MTSVHRSTCVVIVNYRTADLAIAAVASIEAQRDQLAGGLVVVVDNCSGDGSAETLERQVATRGWQSWVRVVPQSRNGGFAFGVNQGIRWLRECLGADRWDVLLLNPDTQVHPGALRHALDAMQAHPEAGIVGCPIRLGEGQVDSSAHRWPTPASELLSQARLGLLDRLLPDHVVSPAPKDGTYLCDWVSGAFFLIRAETLEAIGLFDEGYFLYFEEVEYCRRARAAGWRCLMADGPGITHWEGASTGIADPHKPRPAYWFDSRRRFHVMHHGWLGLATADLFSIAGRALFVIRRWLRVGSATGHDDHPSGYHRMMLAGDLAAFRRRRSTSA